MIHRNFAASRRRRFFALALVPALALLVASCGKKKPEAEVVVDPPDLLYNQALADLESGDTREAGEKFDTIDKEHPYSDEARKAMIMSAFLHFRKAQYQEAINDAERYVTLFPATEDAAYAQYLIGESYFRQIPDVTRDQDLSRKAMDAMNEVVQKYPDSEYANDARQKIDVALDQIAGKEMQIGRYYLERHEYLAAVNRFKTVVQDYQTTRHVEEALHRLTESYLALGIVPEAQTAAAVLGHNFPDSEWYQDSYRLLGKAGVVPEENTGSWISRAFGRG
jgi:outer membrane protein assembly factor BamD